MRKQTLKQREPEILYPRNILKPARLYIVHRRKINLKAH